MPFVVLETALTIAGGLAVAWLVRALLPDARLALPTLLGWFALAFLTFIWGVLNYFFFSGGDEGKRAEGRQFVLWGVLGMVVLFSVWGFVNIVLSTLGITPPA